MTSTYTERAIGLAAEQGYQFKNYSMMELLAIHQFTDLDISAMLLDRGFWIALAKSLGLYPKEIKLGDSWDLGKWENLWLDFIRHLIRRGTVEEYFASLLQEHK